MPSQEIQNLSKLSAYANYLNFSLVFFAAITAVLAWRWGNKAQDLIQAESDKQIAQANAVAEVAKKTTEEVRKENIILNQNLQKLEISNAEARERQAQAELALLQLQKQIQPRILYPEQAATILKGLENKEHTKVSVIYSISDQESSLFSEKISHLLLNAGWEIESSGALYFDSNFPRGLSIEIQSAEAPSAKYGHFLIEAFTSAGLPIKLMFDSKLKKNTVILNIGLKP